MELNWSQELPAAWHGFLVFNCQDDLNEAQKEAARRFIPEHSRCVGASEPWTGSWNGVTVEMRTYRFRYEGERSPWGIDRKHE